jgi:hypothetical protein
MEQTVPNPMIVRMLATDPGRGEQSSLSCRRSLLLLHYTQQ